MNKLTSNTRSTKIMSAMVLTLLFIFFGMASLTVSQFQQTSFQSHKLLMEKVIDTVVEEKLKTIQQNSLRISNTIKSDKEFNIAIELALKGNTADISTLFQNQSRQRMVTSGEVKILNINSYDKHFNLIHATYFNDHIITPPADAPLLTEIKQRRSTERYKAASVFWWTQKKQLVYSTFMSVGGLRLQGYLEVVTDPVHILKQVKGIVAQGLSLKDTNGMLVHESKQWQTLLDKPELKPMRFPVIMQNNQALLSLTILEDFSQMSSLVVRSLIFATLMLLLLGGLAIFFGTYLIRNTELNSMKATTLAAEKAGEAKAHFLASMSHEIRTPLNSIVGFTLLLQKSPLNTQQKETLNRIETASNSLCTVVSDILDFTKIEAENFTLETIDFSPIEELKSVSSTLIFACEEKNIDFLISVKDRVPAKILGDPTRFQQILMNLCNNAVKFTEVGHVKVEFDWQAESTTNGVLSVSVLDTGCGISKKNSPIIFSLFSQGDSSATRELDGAGLGLSISSQLVRLMGGHITLASEEGIGSEFSFEIPVLLDPTNNITLPSVQGNNDRILLIDHNQTCGNFLTETLELAKFSDVHQRSSASTLDLVKRLETPSFDLVIIDWKPSQQSCIDVINYFHEYQKSTPLMLLMSASQAIELELFQAMSIKAYLKKPIFNLEFLSHVKALISGTNLLANLESNKPLIQKSYPGRSCLIVDDNEANIELMCQLIKSYDINVTTAENGQVALEKIQVNLSEKNISNFDIIFMDMMMPVMDGYECIQHIRKNEETANAFICSLTANATTHEREKCFSLGANTFFTKPINVKALESLFVDRFGQPDINVENRKRNDDEKLQYLPEKLPGLDINKALSLLGGREDIYFKVISAFIFEYGDSEKVEAQLNHFLSKDMDIEAKRLAHTIKGISGSLGATELQDAAIQLEMALHDNDQLAGKLTLFWDQFNITLSSCSKVNQLAQR